MQQPDAKLSVLVLGASRGIGAATAAAFVERGHHVTATHRGSGTPTGTTPVLADMRDEDSIAAAVEAAVSTGGQLNVMVVNAGIGRQEPLGQMTAQSAREVFEVNTISAMMAVKHAGEVMRRQGSGSMVLVSSESARRGIPGSSHYTASKAALEGFMRSVMWEYGSQGIRINTVAPGATDTDMLAPLPPERRAKFTESIPLGRFARPEEIAEVICWTAISTFLHGAVIPVTGGQGFGI
ncbi:MAG: SDR family NAD(P)-dependent oxidoreductase [Janthinobacterium lividum]